MKTGKKGTIPGIDTNRGCWMTDPKFSSLKKVTSSFLHHCSSCCDYTSIVTSGAVVADIVLPVPSYESHASAFCPVDC